ncbi:hypothetical protein [Enterococcus hirae]|nr:hypothetical protein [Enterococcus hirae]
MKKTFFYLMIFMSCYRYCKEQKMVIIMGEGPTGIQTLDSL